MNGKGRLSQGSRSAALEEDRGVRCHPSPESWLRAAGNPCVGLAAAPSLRVENQELTLFPDESRAQGLIGT